MKTIRENTPFLAVYIIVASLIIITVIGVTAIKTLGNNDANQKLLLLCETGAKNLDEYFEGVEQSVEMVSAYVESDLVGKDSDELSSHLEEVKDIFARMANSTDGVLTYYYRIDPEISTADKGFWYVNLDGDGFQEHEVTDITQYDTDDTSALVWFTVPKKTGEGIWLPPYVTDNLDKRVISYNEPIYWDGKFIGVIGIEIDYRLMAEQVNNITLYDNGYAFITDAEGNLIYHPRMDVTTMETLPDVPEGMMSSEGTTFRYTFDGVQKLAVCMPLSNGMRLNVAVPAAEINAGWHRWAGLIIVASIILLLLAVFLFIYLQRLTQKKKETDDRNARLEKDLASASELMDLMSAISSMTLNMPAMTFSKDAETGVYLACNQEFAVNAGKNDPKEIIGLTDYDLYNEITAKQFLEKDKIALSMDEAFIYFEDVWDQATCDVRYFQTTKKKYRDAAGKLCILGMCVDVTKTTQAKAEEAATEVRQQEEKNKRELEENYKKDVERLNYQASHDELTGVYNRSGYEQLVKEINLLTTHLLMVDVDDFKSINDTYGHDVGDRVLIKIADTLRRNFRTGDSICRIGGDEFIIFMIRSDDKHRDLIISKIEKINQELGNTEDGLPAVSVSVGIAHGREIDDPTALLELADQAMYESKRDELCRYRFSK